MNKKQRKDLEDKIASVEQTIQILKHQESNLLEAMQMCSYDHHEKEINTWENNLNNFKNI